MVWRGYSRCLPSNVRNSIQVEIARAAEWGRKMGWAFTFGCLWFKASTEALRQSVVIGHEFYWRDIYSRNHSLGLFWVPNDPTSFICVNSESYVSFLRHLAVLCVVRTGHSDKVTLVSAWYKESFHSSIGVTEAGENPIFFQTAQRNTSALSDDLVSKQGTNSLWLVTLRRALLQWKGMKK